MNDHDPLSLIGSTVADKYAIKALAGDGGFSVVYRAEHVIWKQPVAVKFFNILRDAKPETRERLLDDFIQEGRLMSELSSRSTAIVQARDIGKIEIEGSWVPYMVLEWINGAPLDQVIHQELMRGEPCRNLAEAMTLLEPVAAALDVAHRHKIAHRDLKPANIMVLGDPRAEQVNIKVLDFGIAKVMAEHDDLQQQLKATGQEITSFTPHYGAPEQFSRRYGATGPWTDVYAMALILLEVVLGKRALSGLKVYDLGLESCNEQYRPTPRTLGLQVSDIVENIFARCLAVAPAARPPSMSAMWSELHQAVFGVTWRVAGSSLQSVPDLAALPEAATIVTHSPTTPGLTEPIQTSRARGYTLPALALGGIVSLGVAGAYLGSKALSEEAPGKANTSTIDWNGPCPKGMKPVIGGTFTMGSNESIFPVSKPAHEVTIDSYCLDVTEVTVEAYQECVTTGKCSPADKRPSFPKNKGTSEEEHQSLLSAFAEFCNEGRTNRKNHPINCIDWNRADNYCKKRGFRLPNEAEWEYAARGKDGRHYPWGDDPGGYSYMNAAGKEWALWREQKKLPEPHGLMYDRSDEYVGTAPVGQYPRAQTQAGHLDMIGNVWEWTNDWFQIYKTEPQVNPKGAPIGDRKAIRGGGFDSEFSLWVKPAARYHQLATASVHVIGFRCASNLKPQ